MLYKEVKMEFITEGFAMAVWFEGIRNSRSWQKMITSPKIPSSFGDNFSSNERTINPNPIAAMTSKKEYETPGRKRAPG